MVLEQLGRQLDNAIRKILRLPIVDKDAINAQSPLTGTEIPRGGCVDLLVSLGPRPKAYKMPGLKGESLAGALLLIEKSNLVHGDVQSQFFEGKPRRRIVAQEPLAGYRVTEQSSVNLVVNRRKSDTSDDRLPGMKTDGGSVAQGTLQIRN